jgi:hypothetical protein
MMTRAPNAGLLALLLLTVPLVQIPARAQEKIDVSKLGPQVGERVPDFSLRDQNGRIQTLRTVLGPKGGMLVFVRSADW